MRITALVESAAGHQIAVLTHMPASQGSHQW